MGGNRGMNRIFGTRACRAAVLLLMVGLASLLAAPALAHQPFFEETDIPPDRPWRIADPAVSTAVYATLDSPADVDVFAFEGRTGQVVLLSIVIPQIAGQESFAPIMALIGPGLPAASGAVPAAVSVAAGEGVEMVPPPEGAPSTFFEPFTRTSYWERQKRRVSLPADGTYRVAVWHPHGAVGRYVFVTGDAERIGGDPAFMAKLRAYWTPVGSPPPPPVGPVVLWALVGFFSGSLPFSVWIGRLVARADVRRYGDGNPGATNAWRAGGWKAGVPALLLDYLKGAVPVSLAHFAAGLSEWWLVPVALAPIFGHAFSPFLRFRGGKAVAATFGAWTGLTIWAGPTALGLSLGLAYALNATDAWSAILGLFGLLAYLLASGAPAPWLAVWVGNFALVLWKHCRDLRTPPRPRPWLRRLWGKVW